MWQAGISHNPYPLWSKPRLLRGCSGVAQGLPGGKPRKLLAGFWERGKNPGKNIEKDCLKFGKGIGLVV